VASSYHRFRPATQTCFHNTRSVGDGLDIAGSFRQCFEIGARFLNNPILGFGKGGKVANIFGNAAVIFCLQIPATTVFILAGSQLRL
jgi:hypothetical protein